jgi:hypothetical protein
MRMGLEPDRDHISEGLGTSGTECWSGSARHPNEDRYYPNGACQTATQAGGATAAAGRGQQVFLALVRPSALQAVRAGDDGQVLLHGEVGPAPAVAGWYPMRRRSGIVPLAALGTQPV